MAYVDKKLLARARELDALTYLQQHEPQELVALGAGVYRTRSHDSLKLSNGKWYWWSHSVGGRSAVDYLVTVCGMRLPDAVRVVVGDCPPPRPRDRPANSIAPPRELLLPQAHQDDRRIFAYLCARGIHPEIIRHCIKHGLLYEDGTHHNAVFVGRDADGKARHGVMRGTLSDTTFVQDVPGSDKRYCFSLRGTGNTVFVFESAIDALSAATISRSKGRAWRDMNFLSLGGIACARQDNTFAFPAALKQYLIDRPETDSVMLCLDNDASGRAAAELLSCRLTQGGYAVQDCPPPQGKDYNDYLMTLQGTMRRVKTRGEKAR